MLEGGDGGGKSVQAQQLVAWLQGLGRKVCHLREPGSTPAGEALRHLLLDPQTGDLSPLTEALLFSAARAEMLRTQVVPALQAGEIVVVERCYLSTYVYQGVAAPKPVPMPMLQDVTAAVHENLWPHAIFLLDVDDETRWQRQQARGAQDRIEARDPSFHQRVRQGYLQLAATDPRVQQVDAAASIEQVQEVLQRAVRTLMQETLNSEEES